MTSNRLISAAGLGALAAAVLALPQAALADEPEGQAHIVVVGTPEKPLDQTPDLAKTATPLKDLPRTVQIVPIEQLHDQGATKLVDALSNVSSLAQGGQFAFGFYDRAILRGLNVTYLTDGLPDAASELGGIPHSLAGIDRIEVIKGPGSAVYGTSAQGGMINLVHARPADRFALGASVQYGSFNTVTTEGYVTGPTGLAGFDYRLDASYSESDGYRGRFSRFLEVMPALSWRPAGHDVELRVEVRSIDMRPDSIGIPFTPPSGTGLPANVSLENRYYTPFARGNQDIVRVLASDTWALSDTVTIANRLSFSHRTVDILRNAGGSFLANGATYSLRGRQLRRQRDEIDDLVYQLEPRFTFHTGAVKHTLLTGFQAQITDGHVTRATADLPNIPDYLAPVAPETGEAALTFQCNAAHSCADADIAARFYSLYAIDQIDLSEALKLRLSLRNDWDMTSGVATSLVPTNPGMSRPCGPGETPQDPPSKDCRWLQGVPVRRQDSLFSWDVGAVYFIVPQFSLYAGYQNARYPIFNTEEPESIGGVPEGGKQVEVGARLVLGSRLTFTTALFQVDRDSVFALFTDPATNLDVPTVFSYRVRGWEGDLTATPLAHWHVGANFSVQDPVITSMPQTPANVGRVVPSDPRVLVNGFTDYEFALPGHAGALRLSAAVHYRGDSFADAGNTRVLPASTLIDLGLGWRTDHFEAAAGVDNLFDHVNWQGGAGAGSGAIPGPGRTFYLRLSAKL